MDRFPCFPCFIDGQEAGVHGIIHPLSGIQSQTAFKGFYGKPVLCSDREFPVGDNDDILSVHAADIRTIAHLRS